MRVEYLFLGTDSFSPQDEKLLRVLTQKYLTPYLGVEIASLSVKKPSGGGVIRNFVTIKDEEQIGRDKLLELSLTELVFDYLVPAIQEMKDSKIDFMISDYIEDKVEEGKSVFQILYALENFQYNEDGADKFLSSLEYTPILSREPKIIKMFPDDLDDVDDEPVHEKAFSDDAPPWKSDPKDPEDDELMMQRDNPYIGEYFDNLRRAQNYLIEGKYSYICPDCTTKLEEEEGVYSRLPYLYCDLCHETFRGESKNTIRTLELFPVVASEEDGGEDSTKVVVKIPTGIKKKS